mmetsp:Transcript_57381/g.126023  ORF Transcript_57381/g.126023 Transcript_57381/m.126023 type:complete len:479 (+) Transcript_57381:3-1439(+)
MLCPRPCQLLLELMEPLAHLVQLLLELLPLQSTGLGLHAGQPSRALAGEALGLRLGSLGRHPFHVGLQGGLALRGEADLRFELMLHCTHRLHISGGGMVLRLGLLQLRVPGLGAGLLALQGLLRLVELLFQVLHLGLDFGPLPLLLFHRGGAVLEGGGLSLQLTGLGHGRRERCALPCHAPGGGLQGSRGRVTERRRGHPRHRRCEDLGGLLAGGQGACILLQPCQPGLAGLGKALISEAQVPLPHGSLLPLQGLLELLPVLSTHHLIAHRSSLPEVLHLGPLHGKCCAQQLVGHWQLRPAGDRLPRCKGAQSGAGLATQLVGELHASAVLNSFPSAFNTQDCILIHSRDELSHEGYKRHTTYRLPTNGLRVRMTSGDELRAQRLYAYPELVPQSRIRQRLELLQQFLIYGWTHQCVATSLAEEAEEALTDLLGGLAALIAVAEGGSPERLLQVLRRRDRLLVTIDKFELEVAEHPNQ